MWRSQCVLASIFVGFVASTASAHHSFAMFDQESTITLQGTVREFQWVNPHCWIQLVVENEDDEAVEWSIEMSGPGGLIRQGWKPGTLKPDDKVTVVVRPLLSGEAGGSFVSIVLPNGERLGR
jgi:Family of unknown function (DUF6152)